MNCHPVAGERETKFICSSRYVHYKLKAKRTEHGVSPTQEYYPGNTHRSQIHFQLVQCLPAAAAAAAREENSAQIIRNLGN